MALDITSVDNNPPGKLNSGYERNKTSLKFEVVNYDPTLVERKKPGFFSRLLGALGGFAPLAYMAAPFTGGLSLIAGAGLGAMGAIGQKAQQTQALQASQQRVASVVSYPGMMNPGVFASDPAIATIAAKSDNAFGTAIHNM